MMLSLTYYRRLPTGRLMRAPVSDSAGDVAVVTVEGIDEAHVFELPADKPHLDFLFSAVMAAHALGEAAAQEKMRVALGVALITDISQLKAPRR
ncbi:MULTISPECIES: hypothetical protein [unclassified Bradyrhizobium]|uniref:hypothetical protein n=1 Tax=unclassified Bradyrhizobium TaxID=2631580 RepID=UPI002916EF85|nr:MULTISPECIES: hypothetical protein [unclassified Bradyrhizobium]